MAGHINITESGDAITIILHGDFKFGIHSEFRNAYNAADKKSRFFIDLGQAKSMDSSALGMLLQMKEHLGKENGEIGILNCPDNLKKILLIARFDKKFSIS